MKKIVKAFMVSMLFVLLVYAPKSASAAVRNITLNDTDDEQICLNVGDSGQFLMNTVQSPISSWFFSGILPEDTQIASYSYGTNAAADTFTVTEEGNYQAYKTGKVSVRVSGYNQSGICVYYNVYYLYIAPDMTNVSLQKTSYTAYKSTQSESSLRFTDPLVGLTESVSEDVFSVQSSNSKMSVSCSLDGKNIVIIPYGTGTTKLTITLANKTFTINITVIKISLKESSSFLLVKGANKTMHVQGVSKGIKWRSSNTKVVSVTSKGKLKAKKPGNAIITASISGGKLGCVVSVVTKKRKQVINQAVKIGKTCTYSQAKRMQKGFYDCSSLVWRAYRIENKTFGMKNYAPVAADVAKWCASHNKIVKTDKNTNIQKMKYKPGALMFETGAGNGRYKGIYHVEMFIGYRFDGFDSNGKAVVGTKWANRPDNYYGTGDLWANL